MSQKISQQAGKIFSERLINASREQVFAMFMDPDILARWWGPEGFSNRFEVFDPRPGGAWELVMTGPDGREYPMRKQFLEVSKPEKIVLRHNQKGHHFIMTLTFADEADNTRLGWHFSFEAAEQAESVRERIIVANEENFDRLENLLGTKTHSQLA